MASQKEKRVVCVTPKPTFLDKLIFPPMIRAMMQTFKHLFMRKFTIQYPEERKEFRENYRGFHRLNRDEQGRVRCVACFLCATHCPAKCITIEAAPAPWPDREKYPERFEIDELRCIYCGFCAQACPENSIELTPIYDPVATSREEMIWDKEKLLSMYDMTADKSFAEVEGKVKRRRHMGTKYWKT